jgi:ADP-ribosyl-[dinitrogen reductase] hydrolase
MASFRPDPNILKKHPNAITQQQIEEKSRFVGTLLGGAAGEALGAPHEFKSGTELTLALLRSIVTRRRLDVEDVARHYLKWFSANPKDIDALTRAALENLRAGESPAQSGVIAWEDTGRKSAGNGSVMCCAPIGLLHVTSLDGVAEDATAASRITHYDPRCLGFCVAVTTAIAHLVRGESDEAVERAASAGGVVSDDVRAAIERGAARSPGNLRVDGEDRGYVLRTVELAFSALVKAADFEDGVVAVTSRGGDTDANACVAGALLGAKFGKSRIPERWVSKLKAAPELTSLAEQLYRLL